MGRNHQLDNLCRSYFQVGDNHFSQKFIPPSARSGEVYWSRQGIVTYTATAPDYFDEACLFSATWELNKKLGTGRLEVEDPDVIHVENWINSEDHIVWLTFLCGLHDFFWVGTKTQNSP